jgi:hypothetical protein
MGVIPSECLYSTEANNESLIGHYYILFDEKSQYSLSHLVLDIFV